MKVIDWLVENNLNWELLEETYGVKTKHYPEQSLHVLNYDQIASPKMEPIVQECRGLILDYDLRIICRPFDRFFNFGEADTQELAGKTFKWADKRDGSLIKVYMYGGVWHIATRGTAFAESTVGGWDITFTELVFKALGITSYSEFQRLCHASYMIPGYTYLFELTAMENRVVTPYEQPELTFLAARDNITGEYLDYNRQFERLYGNFKKVSWFEATPEEAVKSANKLDGLKEGYVGYDDTGKPVMKVKADSYVAVHHLRGEGLNPRRIAELVASGETEEYLAYFPEEEYLIQPYCTAETEMLKEVQNCFYTNFKIENQKEFAMNVKDHHNSDLMFIARREGIGIVDAYWRLPVTNRAKRILKYKEK